MWCCPCAGLCAARGARSRARRATCLHRRACDVLVRLIVERLAEVHDVEAALAEGRADRRLRRRLARRHREHELGRELRRTAHGDTPRGSWPPLATTFTVLVH